MSPARVDGRLCHRSSRFVEAGLVLKQGGEHLARGGPAHQFLKLDAVGFDGGAQELDTACAYSVYTGERKVYAQAMSSSVSGPCPLPHQAVSATTAH